MPPRQQMPFNSNPFGQHPYQAMRGMRGMRGPGPSGFGMMSPRGMQGNFQGGAGRKSGGLLAKILNRGGSSQAAPSQFNPLQGAAGFQRNTQAAGGSFLKNMLNPGSLNGFLNNTQQVLRTAQQVGPMIQQVQQYGPLVKNLPAMWKLYRGLSAAEVEEEDSNDVSIDDEVQEESVEFHSESETESKRPKKKQKKALDSKSRRKTQTHGGSQPKLYV